MSRQMWTWLSGGFGSPWVAVGLHGLKDLFQPSAFYDSMFVSYKTEV